jgi:hypothetical protein
VVFLGVATATHFLDSSALSKLPDLCLRLLQPEPHVHLAVHRRREGEVLAGLFLIARAPGELAEAEVAVGDEMRGRMPSFPASASASR